ncbi:TetR/AcrR family transcriptional regulator [Paenibacillus sp. FSL R7-0331]|uniref:TetR/AcrR family transcriptional regulator n=1 Tax=Paenibacillus sp. FSL R7-0331 TaxID=1536773 RepID=UPI0004F6B6E5|nr:TetR/AcrR family transcriptional regulator [Paenibacillus sp. FSL R7-0331]AIQ52845.1 TetR family transcriptional regulator [Paenibacillus sp. FSL R7-0331]
MVRVSKNPQERKNEILTVAMELFNSKGYEDTSVSEIVRKVGVSQGTFYNYFQSKEDVLNAACERTLATRLEAINHLVDNCELSAREKLIRIFMDATPNEQDEDVFEYLHKESNSTLHQRWIVIEINALIPYIKKIVQQGAEDGEFLVQQPELKAEFLLVGVAFWLDRGVFTWSEQEYLERKNALNGIIDQLLAANKQ